MHSAVIKSRGPGRSVLARLLVCGGMPWGTPGTPHAGASTLPALGTAAPGCLQPSPAAGARTGPRSALGTRRPVPRGGGGPGSGAFPPLQEGPSPPPTDSDLVPHHHPRAGAAAPPPPGRFPVPRTAKPRCRIPPPNPGDAAAAESRGSGPSSAGPTLPFLSPREAMSRPPKLGAGEEGWGLRLPSWNERSRG